MSVRYFHALSSGLLIFAASCFRYEEHLRPVGPDECQAEAPVRMYSHLTSDSLVQRSLHGRVRAAPIPGSAALLSDSALAPLGDAVIQVEQGRSAHSDSTGRFVVDSLAPGTYFVTIRRIGFEPRRESVIISASAGAVWDVSLKHEITDGCPGFMSIAERKRVWRWPWQ
jgi:hypothetical protein